MQRWTVFPSDTALRIKRSRLTHVVFDDRWASFQDIDVFDGFDDLIPAITIRYDRRPLHVGRHEPVNWQQLEDYFAKPLVLKLQLLPPGTRIPITPEDIVV